MLDTASRSASNAPVAYLGGFGYQAARAPRVKETLLALTDPALCVVTNFAWEQPVTVAATCSVDEALEEMMRAGVRALLVVREAVVTGLITSYDIHGERPLQYLAASGLRRHDEIEVGHVMTPWEHVPSFDWRTLARAWVSDLVTYFVKSPATHVVVIEHAEHAQTFVRGLLSRTRLARQLGRPI